ncbi:MAG: helix-turn-helix domain-containing protein [Methanococcoides sp.]|nr:helix-turn-helix domain-containing protein [Methanococcoides sp.]
MLSEREWYVYELAKELGFSRQFLYLHLKRLEKAGFVESDLRLEDDDMRAKKFFRLKEFNVSLGINDLKPFFE